MKVTHRITVSQYSYCYLLNIDRQIDRQIGIELLHFGPVYIVLHTQVLCVSDVRSWEVPGLPHEDWSPALPQGLLWMMEILTWDFISAFLLSYLERDIKVVRNLVVPLIYAISVSILLSIALSQYMSENSKYTNILLKYCSALSNQKGCGFQQICPSGTSPSGTSHQCTLACSILQKSPLPDWTVWCVVKFIK